MPPHELVVGLFFIIQANVFSEQKHKTTFKTSSQNQSERESSSRERTSEGYEILVTCHHITVVDYYCFFLAFVAP